MRFLRGILNILDRRERARLFTLIFWDTLIGALDVAFLAMLLVVVNFYIKNASLPYIYLLPRSLADRNSVLLLGVFLILFTLKNLLAYWVSGRGYRFIYDTASRLSERNMCHFLKDDYIKYINTDSAVLIRSISQQPIEFSTYILTNFRQIITETALILFTVAAILFYKPTLFLLLFLLLMPAIVLLGWLLKRQLKQVRNNIKKTSSDTLKNLKEALAGYIESNVYNKGEFFVDRYAGQQRQLNHNIRVQQTLQALPSRLIEIFAILGFFILILVSKWLGNGAVDLLTIGVFLAAAYKIIPGTVKILNSAGQMKTYEFTLHDLLQSDIRKAGLNEHADAIRSIRFEKVHFKYADKPVLAGCDFEINAGEMIGFSAGSGRGKTTLINILLGFMEQQEGLVCINDKITSASERKQFRHKISYIKQQPFFIHDTITRNITLQDGNCDENKLKEVAGFCELDQVVAQHPDGFDQVITENGKNLSGGQRQRIMLARALYHDFDLLILDEPFGELDQCSENLILQKLQSVAAQGKMILFVTHSRQSLSYCSKTVSFDEQG
ncbi:MAG TPA: ABC transporter ATP-binding protein [Mucilaginibacter sp.]|nr:ABC transporter ATP-binding protein [Mucilaginibacter sp.]